MKTPMQFLLEKIENGDFLNHPKVIGEFIKYNLLEKEKEVMESAWQDGMYECDGDGTFEDFYKTFNTKEK